MEGVAKRRRVRGFGGWEFFDEEVQIARSSSARKGALFRVAEDEDLFKVPPTITRVASCPEWNRRGGEKKQGKQGRVCYSAGNFRTAPKAVDEDLYKIPPELLYHNSPNRKKILRNLWSGCLGLNCIA